MSDLNVSMFRAYDIRTPAERLTPELAERLASAEAVYFREVLGVPGVLLAHDARLAGPQYLSITAQAFLEAGLEVVVLPGVSSTSLFYFAAMRFPEFAAVMVGASHNPAGDTGQKLLGPGLIPLARSIGPQGGLDRIQELYVERARYHAPRAGRIRACELIWDYLEYSFQQAGVSAGSLQGVRVFHDYLHGAAGREMMLAFDRAGAELTPLHFAADGRFPLGDPNPVKPAVIAPGLRALRASGARIGMFFDGDGDRLDVYRGDGQYLSSSFVYAGVLPEIHKRFHAPGLGVFADLKSSPLAIMEMARCGLKVEVIRNGHSQIKQSLINDPLMIGATEESAHFYEAFTPPGGYARCCTENTLYMALLVARAWAEDPARFDHLIALEQTTARAREWGYKFPTDEHRANALDAVQIHFESARAQSMTRMKNGMDLEATLMRRGLPFDVGAETSLAPDWLQVCQRASESEDRLARWEVVGASRDLVEAARRDIAAIVADHGAGEAYTG